MQHRKKMKITAILVVILVGGIIPVIAQEWKPVVLKATAVRDDGSGYIIITLSDYKGSEERLVECLVRGCS